MTTTHPVPAAEIQLRRQGHTLRSQLFAIALDPSDSRLRPVAAGRAAMRHQRHRIEGMARASVFRLQTGWRLPLPQPESRQMIQFNVLVPENAVRRCPLLAAPGTGIRVCPVPFDVTLVDDHVAMVEGPASHAGDPVLYASTCDDLVLPLRQMRDALLEMSEDVDATVDPPSARQLEVARGIARHDKDIATARRLGTSVRTVEREVAAIVALLDARNRHEAAVILNGESV